MPTERLCKERLLPGSLVLIFPDNATWKVSVLSQSFIRKQITISRTAAKHLLKAPPPIMVRAGILAYPVGVGK